MNILKICFTFFLQSLYLSLSIFDHDQQLHFFSLYSIYLVRLGVLQVHLPTEIFSFLYVKSVTRNL